MPNGATWFPLFEFQDYTYTSFLVLPLKKEGQAAAEANVSRKQWAKGQLFLGQAFRSSEGYTVGGRLQFAEGVELEVSARGAFGEGVEPAPFEAVGVGQQGRTKGVLYTLAGWVFSEPPANGAGRVVGIYGSVQAVRGPDAKPDAELGGMPLGTVGVFAITRV